MHIRYRVFTRRVVYSFFNGEWYSYSKVLDVQSTLGIRNYVGYRNTLRTVLGRKTWGGSFRTGQIEIF